MKDMMEAFKESKLRHSIGPKFERYFSCRGRRSKSFSGCHCAVECIQFYPPLKMVMKTLVVLGWDSSKTAIIRHWCQATPNAKNVPHVQNVLTFFSGTLL